MKRATLILIILALIAGVGAVAVFNTAKVSDRITNSVNQREYYDPNTTVGTLEIDNVQKDNTKNKYTYTVKITSLSGAVKYTLNGSENYKVFNARGEATFEVNSNDKLIIYDVPVGVEYTVTQKDLEGYQTTVDSTTTNTTSGTTTAAEIITFTNKGATTNTNPNTVDSIWIYGVFLIGIGLLIFALSKVKTQRYTTE